MQRTNLSRRYTSIVRLWVGNTASGIATWALPFVLGFAVSANVLSATHLGILLAIRTVGFLIAVPIAGVLADRSGSRPIILKASSTAAFGAILVMFNLRNDDLFGGIFLMLGMLLSGAGQGGCRPVYQSIIPLVVASEGLQSANAAFSLSVRATNLVGPATAVLIATTLGLPAALFAIFILWLLSALLPPWPDDPLRRSENSHREKPGSMYRRLLGDLLEGVAEACRHPWFIAGLFALAAVIGAGYSVTNVILPIVSNLSYGGADLLAGATMSLLLGALLGAVVLVRWKPSMRGWWALGGLGIYAIVPLSLLVPQQYWVPITAYFIAGFGIELFNIIWFTAIQQEVAGAKLARVSSLDFIVSYGLAPAGLAMIAPLSEHFGIKPVLLATTFICFGAALVASAVPTASGFRVAGSRQGSKRMEDV